MKALVLFVVLAAGGVLADDRDDDNRGAPSPPCQCSCACWFGPTASCTCEVGPETCGRLRARECKAVGLRPGCRRCIPTKEGS